MSQLLISVVILNWNGAAHLDECLTSLLGQSMIDQTEIIVVDNASSDRSLEVLERYGQRLQVIKNDRNVGFAAGCNQGIRASGGPTIALLNNDTVVDSAWLAELYAALCSADHVGFCTSKILNYYQHDLIDNTGHVVFPDGLTRGRGRLVADRGQYETVEEVFCMSGCAALLRRAMLDDVGLFDEHFFAYCEDADLGFRARLRGWICLYVPRAIVYHKFSASTETFSPLKALNVERNRFWLALKNLPLPLLLVSPVFTLLRYVWQVYGVLVGRGASGVFARQRSRGSLAKILFLAYLQAFAGLPRVLGQRRVIQARRTVSTGQVWTWLRNFGIGAREMALME